MQVIVQHFVSLFAINRKWFSKSNLNSTPRNILVKTSSKTSLKVCQLNNPGRRELYSFLNKMSDHESSENGPMYEMIINENKENSAPLYDIVEKESKDNIAVTENCCYVSNIMTKQPTTRKDNSWPITSSKIKLTISKSRSSITLTLLSFIFGILIVILTTTTLIGFLRTSMTESDKHVAIKPDLCHNISFNESVTLIPENETLDQTISPIQLLIQHNYSHLQNLFYDNSYLFSLLSECIKRNCLSFVWCSDSVLNLYGKGTILPAKSCRELYNTVPHNSGYYWLTASNGSIIEVYCEMTESCGNVTGGLTRIATLNLNTRSQYCTGDIRFDEEGCFKRSPMPGCSGFTFSPINLNLSYSHICGTVEGSYFGRPNGFAGSGRSSTTIDNNYVDGISLTYGNPSHRTHIWTFSACTGDCTATVPEFVGNHYSTLPPYFRSRSVLMFQRNFLPILNEDIEIRLCQDENRETSPQEGIYLTSMNIYIN